MAKIRTGPESSKVLKLSPKKKYRLRRTDSDSKVATDSISVTESASSSSSTFLVALECAEVDPLVKKNIGCLRAQRFVIVLIMCMIPKRYLTSKYKPI